MTRFAPLAALPLLALASPVAAQTSAPATAAGEPVTRVIVFGDSLADGGFFLPLNPGIPREAGSFTTNPDPVAPEVFAARLGIDLQPVYGRGGTNYAIGGARVAAANGITVPITNQISNFIAAGGTFGANDLVYIQGGGNDFFAFQAGGSTNNAIITTAATQLAAQVSRIQGLGANRIVTFAIQGANAGGLQLFNQTYAAALAAANVNALYFDTNRLFNEIVASPSTFGITNTTGTACIGSSLTCTRATLVAPNANETYLLADSVHPAGITQRIQGQAVASLVEAPEQIAGLGYAAQAQFRSQRDLLEAPMRGGAAREGSSLALFGAGGYHFYDTDGSAQRIGVTQRGFSGVLGLDLSLGGTSGVGLVGGYYDGSGTFDRGNGDYDVTGWTASAYARAGFGPVRLLADGTYGRIDYDRISRRVQLGPANRENRGQTDGDYVAGRLTAAFDLFSAAGVGFGPDLSAQYERVTIDGYAEDAATSTNASFSRQRIESWTGRAGLVARALPGSATGFFARASYEREFDDDPRTITLTPAGAPISYTTTVQRADRDYASFAMGVDGRVLGPLSLRAGVSGQVLRRDRDNLTAFAGLSAAF